VVADGESLVPTRLESDLGEPLGEAPPLRPEAWDALRALLTEHRSLTERLAPEKQCCDQGLRQPLRVGRSYWTVWAIRNPAQAAPRTRASPIQTSIA
jgi:hypothetical protein